MAGGAPWNADSSSMQSKTTAFGRRCRVKGSAIGV
jgi:hypothetical protein